MNRRSQKISFVFALSLHVLLAALLFMSFEKTIIIPAEAPPNPNKEIIDAVMVNNKALKEEVARLDAIDAKKRHQEQERQQELIRKENQAREKREKEEALAMDLKKKNEELKKEAEIQRLAQQQQEQVREKKLKAQMEELKKIQKEKEQALAIKKKIEQERKALETAKQKELAKQKEKELAKQKEEIEAENANQQQANIRVKQDQITHYAMLMRNKIHQNWRQPLGIDLGGFTCKIAVRLMPTGDVIEAIVVESSGNIEFDRSTELAIHKASPLPMPIDPAIANEFRQFTFTFRPEAV